MIYIYFNLSEGKLHVNPFLNVFESISLTRSKTLLKCKMSALKHSMVSLNDETRELKSVLSSLESQISKSQSKIKTAREIIMKRNKTLESCEKQIIEIYTEAANIRKRMKRIVGSKMVEKRYPALKNYFTSSQLGNENNFIKNFNIMKYLESNFERCNENTKQIETEVKRQLEHHTYLKNSLTAKQKEKFKNNKRVHQKEIPWKSGTGRIKQGRVCKKEKIENIRAIHENQTNTPKSRSFLYTSAFIKLNKYTEETSVRRKVSVSLDNTSTNIKNKLDDLQLNVDETKFTLPTETKMESQQSGTYSIANIFNNKIPIIKVNIIYKKWPKKKKYSQISKSESEIIYSQGSELLEDTSFELRFGAKSEPKMALKLDTSNMKDQEDEVNIIYDSHYSQYCKTGYLKFNEATQKVKKKDLVTSEEMEKSKLSEWDKRDVKEVYSNNVIERKRKLYKRVLASIAQLKTTGQLKILLNFKFEPMILFMTKDIKVVKTSRMANTIEKTKGEVIEREEQEIEEIKSFAFNTLNIKTPIKLRLSKSMQEMVFPENQYQQLPIRNHSQLQCKILLSYQNITEKYADFGRLEQVFGMYCNENPSIYGPDLEDTSRVELQKIKEAIQKTNKDQNNSKPLINIGIDAETQTSSQKENFKVIQETRDQATGTNLVESLRNKTVYIAGKKPQEETQYKEYSCKNTVMKKKQLTKEVKNVILHSKQRKFSKQSEDSKHLRTQGPSIFNKKKTKDVKLCEKSGAVTAALQKRGKKNLGQKCKSLNNNRTIQGKIKIMKSIGKEDQLNKNKNINNNGLGVKSISELDTIKLDLREVVQQMIKVELENIFKNQTGSKIDTDTIVKVEETDLDTDSKLECEINTQQNTMNEEINRNEKLSESIELLPVSDNIKDETVFHMIHSLENLQTSLSRCQTNDNIKFPKETLEKLFDVFIELMTKLNEFRKSNDEMVSTSKNVNINEGTIQESLLALQDYTEMESYLDKTNEKLEVEINKDIQLIAIQKIKSTEETQLLDEKDTKKEDINEEQIIISQNKSSTTSQIDKEGCRLDRNLKETEDIDICSPHKRVRFEQNSSCEIKSSSRCLEADRLQRNQEKVDCGVSVKPNKNHYSTKRDFGVSSSMTKSKVDFGTSFDSTKKQFSRPKTCTCNCIKSQNRGHFGIITELMRSMDKAHHVNKFNLKARDFQNYYDQNRICRTVTNLMRGLGDEQKVIGPTGRNNVGKCQKVTNSREFQSVDKEKNYNDLAVVDMKNSLEYGLIPDLGQFNSKRKSIFEDLLPFSKRFVLTPRRSYY